MNRRTSLALLTVLAIACTAMVAHAATSTPKPATHTTSHHSTNSSATTTKTTKHHETPKVDINTATKEELMKLPAVGDAIADKIIAGRPWKAKSELVEKQVMTKSSYEKVSHMIIAKEPAKEPAKAAPTTGK